MDFDAAAPNGRSLPAAAAASNGRSLPAVAAENPLPIAVVQALAATAANGHAQILETALKIGIWATGICTAGFISVLMGSSSGFQANSRVEMVLVVACMLAMLASCISGGALLILATVHPHPHPHPHLPISSIRTIIAVTIASMATIVCTGFALEVCKMEEARKHGG